MTKNLGMRESIRLFVAHTKKFVSKQLAQGSYAKQFGAAKTWTAAPRI